MTISRWSGLSLLLLLFFAQPAGALSEYHYYFFKKPVSLTGPGLNIWTTDRTGSDGANSADYTWFGGTSAASPGVAGVAALILSWAANLDIDETEGILAKSAMDLGPVGWDEKFGAGLPNARNALDIIAIFDDNFETADLSQWTNSGEN